MTPDRREQRRGPVAASGPGSLAISGDVKDSVLVLGDDNVLEINLANDALLRQVIDAGKLEITRRSAPRTPCPRRFSDHLDRDAEVAAVHSQRGHVNLIGRRGIGKTYVLLAALSEAEALSDGTVYLDADGRAADDLLTAIWHELHDCDERIVVSPERRRRELATVSATVAIDAAGPETQDAQRLLLEAPDSRFITTSRRRVLPQAAKVRIDGLPAEAVEQLVEAELGSALDDSGRRAAAQLADWFDGHPVLLCQAASLADELGTGLAEVAASLAAADPVASLSERLQASLADEDRELLRHLAASGGPPVASAALEPVIEGDAARRLAGMEVRRLLLSHSPRYTLAGALADAPPVADEHQIVKTAEGLARWAASAHTGAIADQSALLLAMMRWAREHGHDRLVVEFGRAVDRALAGGRRWAGWLQSLTLVRDAAADGFDPGAHAWALHQLGTRAFALGDPGRAVELLEQALAERHDLRDAQGEAATSHNLDFIRGSGPPPEDDEPPEPDGPWLHGARALIAGVAAVAVVAGGAVLAFGGDGQGGGGEEEEAARGSPPTVEIATPANGGRYAPNSVVLAAFRCLEAQTGRPLRGPDCRGTRRPNARIDTSPGEHTFRVRATGDDGLTKTSTVAYVATRKGRDRQQPTITLKAPREGERYTPGERVTAAYACADGAGSGIAECRGTKPNGRRVSTKVGRHRFSVRAVDRDGNVAVKQILYFVPDPENPDTQDPTVTISSPESTRYDEGASITAVFTCADDRGEPTCSATVTPTAAGGEPIPVREGDTLPNTRGAYTFTVTAVDSAGNDASDSRTYKVSGGPDTGSSACSDGRDNDQDKLTDGKDPGCTSEEDNDETNLGPGDCPDPVESDCGDQPPSLPPPDDVPLVDPKSQTADG